MRVSVTCPYDDCDANFTVEALIEETVEKMVGEGELKDWAECPKCGKEIALEISVSLECEEFEVDDEKGEK